MIPSEDNHFLANLDKQEEKGSHSGPKIPKSEPRGDSPRFIVHLKEGHIVISKNKIFFKSVEGNFC